MIEISFYMAGIAQLVEQLIRNQQVCGSNPHAGSSKPRHLTNFMDKCLSLSLVSNSKYFNMPKINNKIVIPDNELSFTFSRSRGPGGQNVNKLNTKVTLKFDVDASACLTGAQKGLIKKRLNPRINFKGVLQVHSGRHRSQHANREDAIDRFARLMASALAQKPPRKRTRLPEAARIRRLEAKRHRSKIKRGRSKHITIDTLY